MGSATSVPFKASLVTHDRITEEHRTEETRCFYAAIDNPDGNISFPNFKQKLRSQFHPLLEGLNFEICWIDEDGDWVYISSDEELRIAVSKLGGDFKKIYIYPLPKPMAKSESSKAEVHIKMHDTPSYS